MKEDNISDYVFIDGVHLRKEALLKMARNVGNPTVAEHYIFFLQRHAYMYKMHELLEELQRIWVNHQFVPLPNPKPSPDSDKYAPSFNPLFESREEKARKAYRRMKPGERIAVLRTSLLLLRLENEPLFTKSACWIGIYLVVRDRLDSMLKPKDFYDNYASKCMPTNWPENLKIKDKTLRNISRYVKTEESDLAYYDMDHNPFNDLCSEFWGILLEQILNIIEEKSESDGNYSAPMYE